MTSISSWVRTQDVSMEIDRLHERLLTEISAAPRDSPARDHLQCAEISLLEFKEEFMRVIEERMNAVRRASQRTHPRTDPTYDRRIPTLFVGNQQVLTILVYNMHKVSKKALGDMLLACGQADFHIDAVFVKGQHRCSARVTCDNLASSTKMQCDAILNKLFFKGRRGGETGRRYVKVCPFKNNVMPTSSPLAAQVPEGSSSACLEAFRLDPVVSAIIRYLDNDSKLALITAFERWRMVRDKLGHLNFDTGCWRYQAENGLQRMKDDARQFYFSSITIRKEWPIGVSDFENLLNTNVGKPLSQVERTRLKGVDLRGVIGTPTVLEILLRHFSMESLVIGKTTGFFESKVNLEGVVTLAVHDNPMVRLAWMKREEGHEQRIWTPWLSHQAELTLTSINLVNCPQLRVKFLMHFIDYNQVLTELSLVDCTNIDERLQMYQLPETVFNSRNVLRIFRMEYNNTTTESLNVTYQPVLRSHPSLRELSLKGSKFIEQSLQTYLDCAPALRVIDFTGLDIPQKKLNFSRLRFLTSLKLPYHHGIGDTLDTLAALRVRDVVITNSLDKNMENRTFSPRFVGDVLTRVPSFSFVALRCKIYLNHTTRRYIRAYGAYITPIDPATNGDAFHERFEIKNNMSKPIVNSRFSS